MAPGGIILPDVAQLHVTGVDDRLYLGEQTKLWGRRMGPGEGFVVKPAVNAVIKHPRVDSVGRSQLVTDTQQLLALDLYTTRLQVCGLLVGAGCDVCYVVVFCKGVCNPQDRCLIESHADAPAVLPPLLQHPCAVAAVCSGPELQAGSAADSTAA